MSLTFVHSTHSLLFAGHLECMRFTFAFHLKHVFCAVCAVESGGDLILHSADMISHFIKAVN